MKKYLISLIVLVFLAGTSCQEKIDIEEEKKAIIAVIEEETDAAVHSDYERWANTYVQDETNIRLSASSNDYNYVVGWDELSSNFKEAFEETADQEPMSRGVKTNYKIKVYGNAAWAVCDEKFVSTETGEDMGWSAIEARFLEKVDGEWKMVFLSFVTTSSYEDEDEEMGAKEGKPETEDTE